MSTPSDRSERDPGHSGESVSDDRRGQHGGIATRYAQGGGVRRAPSRTPFRRKVKVIHRVGCVTGMCGFIWRVR